MVVLTYIGLELDINSIIPRLSAKEKLERDGWRQFKKEDKLHSLTGAQVATLVISAARRPYTHGCPSFRDTIQRYLVAVQESGEGETEWWRSWIDSIQVERYKDEEALLLLKKGLEDIQRMLDETELIHNLLADKDYLPQQLCL